MKFKSARIGLALAFMTYALGVSISTIPGCATKGEKITKEQKHVDQTKAAEDKAKSNLQAAEKKQLEASAGPAFGTGEAIVAAKNNLTNDVETAGRAINLADILNKRVQLLLGPPSLEIANAYATMVQNWIAKDVERQKVAMDSLAKRDAENIALQNQIESLRRDAIDKEEKRIAAEKIRDEQSKLDAADASQWRALQAKNMFQKIFAIVGPIGLAAAAFFFPMAAPLLTRASGWLSTALTPKAAGILGVVPTGTLDRAVAGLADYRNQLKAAANKDPNLKVSPTALLQVLNQSMSGSMNESDDKIVDSRRAVLSVDKDPVDLHAAFGS